MKILHSADWHLDSPLQGRTPEQTAYLKASLLRIPQMVTDLAIREGCDLMLLSGDLFDGSYTAASLDALREALSSLRIPVVIAPGNHDYIGAGAPWLTASWPGNVHIFQKNRMESVSIPSLNCRIYGAAFTAPVCQPLLEGFRAECSEQYAIGLLHGDPTGAASPYCPISEAQVRESGLDYLALGHIHKQGSFQAGDTLCVWPGSPMGRGYDEQGQHGVVIAELDGGSRFRFLPLDLPGFHRIRLEATDDPLTALNSCLGAVGNNDFYQITLTGEWEPPDLGALRATLSRFPNLELTDSTLPPTDLWATAGEDSLEGVFFGKMQEDLENLPADREKILLAARISRLLLSGREVELP